MDDIRPSENQRDEPGSTPEWRVDRAATRAQLRSGVPADGAGGKVVFVDEDGRRRSLPADTSRLSRPEAGAAARAMSYELGAVEASYAQVAAIERLNELRIAGRFSEEDYLREKRRILGQG